MKWWALAYFLGGEFENTPDFMGFYNSHKKTNNFFITDKVSLRIIFIICFVCIKIPPYKRPE